MLPHNHLVAVDFERQSRERIKEASENSRVYRSAVAYSNKQGKPVKKQFFGLGWLKDLGLNPAS